MLLILVEVSVNVANVSVTSMLLILLSYWRYQRMLLIL